MRQSLKAIFIFMFMINMLSAQTYLIDETFGTVPPNGWTNGSPGWSKGTTAHDGDNSSMTASSNNAVIVSPAVTDPDRITFWYNAGGGKPTDMSIAYSASSSGPFTTLSTFTPSNNTWTQYTEELTLPPGTYYFQFKLLGNKQTYVDELEVTQSIVSSTSSLTGFAYEPSSGPSAEQSFSVSGADLSANVTVSAPTNYEVSTTSGGSFGSSVSLTPSNGVLASTTIYVRLKSDLLSGTYNENITISSTGKISKTVACSGYVRQSINPSTETLSNFNYEPDNGPSAEQSLTVSGQDLTANIVLNAPANYEISTTSGSGFDSSVTLTQSGGTVNSTAIYVRLKSGLTAGSYNENITISSTGKIGKTVACSGDVRQSINPSISSLSNFNYNSGSGPSAEQSFTVSGQDLTANIVLNAPANYEISITSGSGFSSSVTLTQSSGMVNSTTIYVRLKSGLSQGSYNSENITISSTGKVSRFIICNGFVGPLSLNVKVFLDGGF